MSATLGEEKAKQLMALRNDGCIPLTEEDLRMVEAAIQVQQARELTLCIRSRIVYMFKHSLRRDSEDWQRMSSKSDRLEHPTTLRPLEVVISDVLMEILTDGIAAHAATSR